MRTRCLEMRKVGRCFPESSACRSLTGVNSPTLSLTTWFQERMISFCMFRAYTSVIILDYQMLNGHVKIRMYQNISPVLSWSPVHCERFYQF